MRAPARVTELMLPAFLVAVVAEATSLVMWAAAPRNNYHPQGPTVTLERRTVPV
jgi:hypothetical protein